MKRPVLLLGLVLGLATVAAVPALAAGGSAAPIPSPAAEPEKTPEQLAVEHYNRGLMHRDRAWKLEQKAQDAPAEKAGKLRKKIEGAYRRAADEFRRAIDNEPRLYQAHSSLGYALRRLGEFEDSLAAYDRALQLNPDYTEAIEYRAEAYLGLNRLDDARSAYMQLFRQDREKADELMAAMKRWLAARQAESAGVDASTLEAFAQWLAEREEIARQTASLTPAGGSKSRW